MATNDTKHDTAPSKSETARREEEVAAYWKERRIFERTLEKDAPHGTFAFYDGPPFATGLPHMGHLLGSTIKDVVGRYKTMQGYHVPRRWGWDCHGLPVENIVEKKLGLATKKDIDTIGIERFNEEARSTVLAYVNDWKVYVERLGRFVDFDHSYKTMDNAYIESVWGGLKKIYDDGRLYEGKKVLMYCPRCETPLSKAEIAMDNSYKDVTDTAVYVTFKIQNSTCKTTERNVQRDDVYTWLGIPDDGKPVHILAWTTTPWTLPANVALAVGEDIVYVLAEHAGEYLIVAKERLSTLGNTARTVREFPGSRLVGMSYEPLYEVAKARAAKSEKAWTVLPANFVTTDEGTGVVHIAPMYGEDDYNLGVAHGLPVVPLLDASGSYNADAPELVRGQYFKKGGKIVVEDLAARSLLFASHPHTHSYPHCYRCGTALIYNALTSWFIDIQSVKARLLEANEAVSWYPAHLKHGRFKNTVETAPDWTISRNRYWASPLPIWKDGEGKVTVFGSLSELRSSTKKSGNTYLMLRHGQAQNNIEHIVSSSPAHEHHLTEQGARYIRSVAEQLKGRGITTIITSPLIRTRETAEIVAEVLELPAADVVSDARLAEWQLGSLDLRPVEDIKRECPTLLDRFVKRCAPDAETLTEMKRRIGEALYDLESRYANETILIVGHEYTLWLAACVARGATIDECITIRGTRPDFVDNGELMELDFVTLPHNAEYELDLHRPYIDRIKVTNTEGEVLTRIPEVVDCWVESGIMPVASQRALGEPFTRPERYPGDFIAEYIAQTRTWFYYMHAMGVLLFNAPSFKHCVSTGTVLAEDGSKMSKSKGNFTDPMVNMDRFGADALRLYLLGSVVMQAEDMHFRDEELKEMHNRFIGILWNTYKFYEMYVGVAASGQRTSAEQNTAHESASDNVLDQWILARLAEVTRDTTLHLDGYDTVRAVRTLRDFVNDLSTWYLRRSRDRFKGNDERDRTCAVATMRHVLETLARLLAPLAPFVAESIYRGVGGGEESVHLASWPSAGTPLNDVLQRMEATRSIVSSALEVRNAAGIKVRQPLASLTIPSDVDVYEDLVKEEVNVKNVVRGESLALDTEITDVLRREGDVRELVRAVQDLRKKAGLQPEDVITLTVDTDEAGKELVEDAMTELQRVAGVTGSTYVDDSEGATVSIGSTELKVALTTRSNTHGAQ